MRLCVAALVSVASALASAASAAPAPAPAAPLSSQPQAAKLELTYLGVAGWQLTDGAHVLLVDPYFTRADVTDDKAPLSPDVAAIERYAPACADAVLVGHSHYDHVLDVPAISVRTGAVVVGTESTLNVARAAGVPEARLLAARAGETLAIGPFSIRAVRGLHSLTGQAYAEIPRGVTLPMSAAA